jgi:hypothetical protein
MQFGWVYYCGSLKPLTAFGSLRTTEVTCDVTIKSGENSDFPLVDSNGTLLDGDGNGQPGGAYRKVFRENPDKLHKPGVTIQGGM